MVVKYDVFQEKYMINGSILGNMQKDVEISLLENYSKLRRFHGESFPLCMKGQDLEYIGAVMLKKKNNLLGLIEN